MIKAIIVDNHKLVREELSSMLHNKEGIRILNQFESAQKAIDYLDKVKVDLVLMDVKMPDMNGIEATRIINKLHPRLPVLALSMFHDKSNIIDMFKSGAKGYALKTSEESELIKAIKDVTNGELYYAKEVSDTMLISLLNQTSKRKINNPDLSKRENEVLTFVLDGLTDKDIGEKLQISKRTVEKHRQNIMKKYNVNKTVQLIALLN